MNNNELARQIHAAFNRELIRRNLIKYFMTKGFTESFNKKIYPPMIQDLIVQVPPLGGKVEIVPWVEEIDPITGVVKLGWNLFVLGNRRMYLGESIHTNLTEVRVAVTGPLNNNIPDGTTNITPNKIINFVVNILGESRSGDITKTPKNIVPRNYAMPLGAGGSIGFFRGSQRPAY